MSSFEDDFLKGQQDCIDGKTANPSGSIAYNRGYGTQYHWEQQQTARTDGALEDRRHAR